MIYQQMKIIIIKGFLVLSCMCVCGIVGIRTSDISVELIGHFLNETYNLFMENYVRLLFFPALLANLIRDVPNKATLFPILSPRVWLSPTISKSI